MCTYFKNLVNKGFKINIILYASPSIICKNIIKSCWGDAIVAYIYKQSKRHVHIILSLDSNMESITLYILLSLDSNMLQKLSD